MLRAERFVIKRYKGSHAIFENETGDVAVVPLNHPAKKVSPMVWRSCKKYVNPDGQWNNGRPPFRDSRKRKPG